MDGYGGAPLPAMEIGHGHGAMGAELQRNWEIDGNGTFVISLIHIS